MLRKGRWLLILLLLIVLVALSACEDSGNGDVSGVPAKRENSIFLQMIRKRMDRTSCHGWNFKSR